MTTAAVPPVLDEDVLGSVFFLYRSIDDAWSGLGPAGAGVFIHAGDNRPRPEIFAPEDETVVCRCEEVTAGQIREAAKLGRIGPNQVKTFTRSGMGPCQGRQCSYTVSHILAATQGVPVADIGFPRIRRPLKPVKVGELASLEREEACVNPVR